MKRKLLIILLILFVLSVAIGTSPIVDYFYSLGEEATTEAPADTTPIEETDEIDPKTVYFAIALSSVTVLVSFVVYLRKRKV